MKDDLNPDAIVSTGFLAQVLDLTVRRVYQLVDEGVIPRKSAGKFVVRDAVTGYVRFLRQQLPKGGGPDQLSEQRARLASAQAEREEMKNALARKELAPMSVIVQTVHRCAAHASDVLEGIPLAVKRRAPGVDHKVLKVIEEEVARARTMAADMKIDTTKASRPKVLAEESTEDTTE